MCDRIEILPVSLLESEKTTIVELKALANQLKLEFGWHYLLDLSWIIRYLDKINGHNMIDAGAGTGVMQWYLAKKGARLLSIDRESTDRQAFKTAVNILQSQPVPLVIFPEGDIYHTTDRVTPFREGAAAIALSAARRNDRPVV